MNTAADIYAKLQSDRQERAEKKREAEKLLHDESLRGSARYHRASQFSHQVMSLLRDYIPEACARDALEVLMLNAISLDVEIVQVPPERDAEREAALKLAEVTLQPKFIPIN